MNTPADAFHAMIPLEHGDVVIVATDGLFDTLFDEDIANMLDEYVRSQYRACFPQLSFATARIYCTPHEYSRASYATLVLLE